MRERRDRVACMDEKIRVLVFYGERDLRVIPTVLWELIAPQGGHDG